MLVAHSDARHWTRLTCGEQLLLLACWLALLIMVIGANICLAQDDFMNIDAFNLEKCGQAKLSAWQQKQRAYNGCTDLRRSPRPVEPYPFLEEQGQQLLDDYEVKGAPDPIPTEIEDTVNNSRVVNGVLANEGQYPYYVRLMSKTTKGVTSCGSTLVHNDILITAAHCVKNRLAMSAVLGTNQLSHRGAVIVKAAMWCYHRDHISENGRLAKDLAIVRLARPVRYRPGKIWPACMLESRHKSPTTCSIAGFGRQSDELPPPKSLMNLQIRRECPHRNRKPDTSCYQPARAGGVCMGDSGGPILCYDKCADRSRAFLVGAVSGVYKMNTKKNCPIGGTTPFIVIDLNWQDKFLRELLRTVRTNVNPPPHMQCYSG